MAVAVPGKAATLSWEHCVATVHEAATVPDAAVYTHAVAVVDPVGVSNVVVHKREVATAKAHVVPTVHRKSLSCLPAMSVSRTGCARTRPGANESVGARWQKERTGTARRARPGTGSGPRYRIVADICALERLCGGGRCSRGVERPAIDFDTICYESSHSGR